MSDLKESGFKTGDVLSALEQSLSKMSDADKTKLKKSTNGIFQLNIKGEGGKEAKWTIDMKEAGKVTKGEHKKPDVTMTLTDADFQDLADGKLNGQKAFMSGKLKLKGNMMLATKLDNVLKAAKASAKL